MAPFREIYIRSTSFIKKHRLIDDERHIMVGLSGGKDSMALLQVLSSFQRHSRYKYKLAAGYVDLGLGADYAPLATFCRDLDVPFFREPTYIGTVVFDIRKEKNPCSLCAKMRRGALNDLAKREGYDKVALGHNQDDYIETFLLNTFFEGRIGTFAPLTYLDRKEVTVIRPLLSVPEKLLLRHSRATLLPLVKNPCPVDGKTKRADMLRILDEIEQLHRGSKELAFRALERLELGERGEKWQK